MPRREPPKTESATELSVAQEMYRLIHRNPAWLVDDLAAAAQVSTAEVEGALDSLERTGLLAPSTANPGGYAAIDPDAALSRLFATEERLEARHREQMAHTRESIRTIMSGFVKLRAEEREVVEIEPLRTGRRVNAFLDDAVSMVQSHECTMHPGGIPPVELMDDMLLRDSEVMSRGIAVRTLYAQHIADVPHMREYLIATAQLGMEVRLAPELPLRMLIFDDDLAILPIDPLDTSQGAFALRGVEIVRSLQAFFDFCWNNARPLEHYARDARREIEFSAQELLIVRMLAAGVKDETIARQLGVSTRTLSRAVSVLLDRLGARSRFQAALRIADLGLLDTTPPANAAAS